MALYSECKCLDSRLASILRKAVDNLAQYDPTYVGVDTNISSLREQKKREIQAWIAGMPENLRLSQIEIKKLEEAALKGLELPKEAEELEALHKYIDSCECPPGQQHIDWMKFPYHEITYGKTSTGRTRSTPAGQCSTDIPSDTLAEWTAKVRKYNEKYMTFLTEDVFHDMNAKYGTSNDPKTGWAQAKLRDELVTQGILNEWEKTEWYDLNAKIANNCQGIDGERTDLIHNADSHIQRLRAKMAESHNIDLLKKESFGFGKKKR